MFDVLKSMLGSGTVPSISPEEAKALRRKGALVVDVREPAEVQRSGKVKHAINIPVGQITGHADPASQHYDNRFRKDAPIIVYCASGMRSAKAGAALKSLGFTEVYNLGGFSAWQSSGGETEAA